MFVFHAQEGTVLPTNTSGSIKLVVIDDIMVTLCIVVFLSEAEIVV